eukprot:8791363-Alexandrium_andersonii.AAC.1
MAAARTIRSQMTGALGNTAQSSPREGQAGRGRGHVRAITHRLRVEVMLQSQRPCALCCCGSSMTTVSAPLATPSFPTTYFQ